jgi:hypothetical protein
MIARILHYLGLPLVERAIPGLADDQLLGQNYPNPFSEFTYIPYQVKQAGKVALQVFDLQGYLVNTLISANLDPDKYRHLFVARGQNGEPLATGVYLVVLRSPGQALETRKMLLLK